MKQNKITTKLLRTFHILTFGLPIFALHFITTIDACYKAEMKEEQYAKETLLNTMGFFGMCSNKHYGSIPAEEWVKKRYGENAFIEQVSLEKSSVTLDPYVFLIKIYRNDTSAQENSKKLEKLFTEGGKW